MDIYNLINSKAISDHCRAIAHQFNAVEMAYLVYANEFLNIAQKHAAFEEIIREQPDMEVPERLFTPHLDSLHDFLCLYMELENKYLAIFYREEPNSFYSYAALCPGDHKPTEDGRLFSDYSACYQAIRAEVDSFLAAGEQNTFLFDFLVKKQWVNEKGDEDPKSISIVIDHDGNPTQIHSYYIESHADRTVLLAFGDLWLEIPTPFQRGDIVIAPGNQKAECYPFVLDRIPYWDEGGKYKEEIDFLRENGDCLDMLAAVYGQDGDGSIWHGQGLNYLDMEYCERELHGAERILIALSNYLKGELPLELLLRAYDILKNEQCVQEGLACIEGRDIDLQKAGIEER